MIQSSWKATQASPEVLRCWVENMPFAQRWASVMAAALPLAQEVLLGWSPDSGWVAQIKPSMVLSFEMSQGECLTCYTVSLGKDIEKSQSSWEECLRVVAQGDGVPSGLYKTWHEGMQWMANPLHEIPVKVLKQWYEAGGSCEGIKLWAQSFPFTQSKIQKRFGTRVAEQWDALEDSIRGLHEDETSREGLKMLMPWLVCHVHPYQQEVAALWSELEAVELQEALREDRASIVWHPQEGIQEPTLKEVIVINERTRQWQKEQEKERAHEMDTGSVAEKRTAGEYTGRAKSKRL